LENPGIRLNFTGGNQCDNQGQIHFRSSKMQNLWHNKLNMLSVTTMLAPLPFVLVTFPANGEYDGTPDL
jgi:hypothetical protein